MVHLGSKVRSYTVSPFNQQAYAQEINCSINKQYATNRIFFFNNNLQEIALFNVNTFSECQDGSKHGLDPVNYWFMHQKIKKKIKI